ncbi:MAG: hypothetical protein LW834_13965 [Cyanobium sp. 49614_E6]|jgi:hypothetical protein|nr:hypothetical protein [Cyanobium sp. 49614_E6]MCE2838043.1 hypothetical protein [Cyanobium sp. 49614_E6]
MSLAFGDVTRDGYGYGSILRAIERLILMRSPTLPNQYQANFEGITRALWDLGTVLSGTVPPPATSVIGPLPPNWNTATGGYNAGGTPGDGSFWFDTRQGRLFVASSGEWHQTNGAEAFVHLGPTPPNREVPGAVWFDTRQGITFVYLDAVTSGGSAGWYQMNGGAGGTSGATSFSALSDVQDDPVVRDIPADKLGGVVVRDERSRLHTPAAYRVTNKLDLGAYSLIGGLSVLVLHALLGVQAV